MPYSRRHSRAGAAGIVALLFLAATAHAGIALDPPFGDGMVLQRDRRIPVRGSAAAMARISVRFAGREKSVVADADGRFEAFLEPLAPGPPRQLTVQSFDGDALVIADVLVGEVWLCSGQSNMYWPVARSQDAAAEIAAAKHPTLRLLTVPPRLAKEPESDMATRWFTCSPQTVSRFSGVGYFFGRELVKRLSVPVGLLHASWGGTPAEAWTRAEALTDDALRRGHATMQESEKLSPKSPSTLYNGMIAPLTRFPIRGVIWYQGESNATRAKQYRTLFPAMIKDWRTQWGQADLPFLFVQLANYGRDPPGARRSPWAELRDAQLHTLKTVPGTGMAVTIDVGDPANIHPVNKQEVGRRLALWALAGTYGKKLVHSGPILRGHEVRGGRVYLRFEHTGGGLRLRSGEGFEIAGPDRKFCPAKVKVVGKSVVVWHGEIEKPAAVRYAWANSPPATLVNREGLPASPFQTDDW